MSIGLWRVCMMGIGLWACEPVHVRVWVCEGGVVSQRACHHEKGISGAEEGQGCVMPGCGGGGQREIRGVWCLCGGVWGGGRTTVWHARHVVAPLTAGAQGHDIIDRGA